MLYIIRDRDTDLMYGPFFEYEEAVQETEFKEINSYFIFKIEGSLM